MIHKPKRKRTTFTLDGRRRTIYTSLAATIDRISGSWHVGMTDAAIRAQMADRCTRAGVGAMAQLGLICDYAVWRHRKNQDVYRAVMQTTRIYAEAMKAGCEAAMRELDGPT